MELAICTRVSDNREYLQEMFLRFPTSQAKDKLKHWTLHVQLHGRILTLKIYKMARDLWSKFVKFDVDGRIKS